MVEYVNKCKHQEKVSSFRLGSFGMGFRLENIYLKSSILIINYSAISAAIKDRNWMDGSSASWMTLPFWEALQIRNILMDLVDH